MRTKTFKITVKAADYEAALKPEVWPYRVAVRHYRSPRRNADSWSGQSGRTGGLVDLGERGGGAVGGRPAEQGGGQANARDEVGTRQFPVGHQFRKQGRHQQMEQRLPDPVQLKNLFGMLGQLGSLEM